MKFPFLSLLGNPYTNDTSPERSRVSRELAFYLVGFLTIRLVILATLGFMLHGQEICEDLFYQGLLVDDPWIILLRRAGDIASYAPFEGFLTVVFMAPLRYVLPDFYAWRLTFLAWEGLTGAIFVLLLNRTIASSRLRRRILLAFILCPVCWMSSVVMPQDEVLIAFFLTLVLWLVAAGRPWAALFACGAGVVGAKIFLVLPLVVLVLVLPRGNLVTRGLAGFGLIAVTYSYLFLSSWWHGVEPPLVNFVPVPTYGINVWPWLFAHFAIPVKLAQRASGMLALLLCSWPLAVLIRCPERLRVAPPVLAHELARLFAVMYLLFFTVFYQVNPEYYELFFPALLLLFLSYPQLALLTIATMLPWLTNLFYGVRVASLRGVNGRPGKVFFVDLYNRWIPLSLDHSYALSYWLGIAALTLLTVVGTRAFLRRPST